MSTRPVEKSSYGAGTTSSGRSAALLAMRRDPPGDVLEHLEVVEDLASYARPLDLDDHVAPGAPAMRTQRRGVHLAKAGCGQGRLIEVIEDAGQADTELVLDRRAHLVEAERFQVVLQPGQRVQIWRRHQIGARR